jgi:hypothetical protein
MVPCPVNTRTASFSRHEARSMLKWSSLFSECLSNRHLHPSQELDTIRFQRCFTGWRKIGDHGFASESLHGALRVASYFYTFAACNAESRVHVSSDR